MQNGLQKELRQIILLGLFLLVLGLLNGRILITLLLGMTLYMAWTFLHVFELFRWLNSGRTQPPPDAYGVWGDITDQLYRLQQQNARALEAQSDILNRVRLVTEALDQGIVLLDEQLEIDWWNPASEKLLGLKKDDRHQAITNLLRAPEFVNFMHRRAFKKDLEMTSPIDDQVSLLISAALFDNNNIVLVIRDISPLRRIDRMRTDFVANVSHELRTPLTVLSGYIETLQDNAESLPPAWHKALAQMQQQTLRMNTLANDLSLLSNIEAREQKRPTGEVRLFPLLEQIARDAEALMKEDHSLEMTCPQDLTLIGDQDELYSAFSNLVMNAIKHNPGGCNVQLTAENTDSATIVSVSDDGIGIDSKHIGRLTERFYKVDQSRSGKTGGTGLGLAIVKHIVLHHHGTLSIQGKPGEGITFRCRFAH